MAKTIVIAAAALLLGIFLGGIGPRADLQRTQAALKEAEAQAKRGGGASALPLALGLGALGAARERAQDQAAEAGGRRVPRFVDSPATTDDDDEAAKPDPDDGAGVGETHLDPKAFAAAKTAVDLRAAQFRAAFVEQARLSPQAVAALDATVNGMNAELGRAADEIVAALAAKQAKREKLSPRDMADVGARVLDIYRRADDQLKTGLDENGRTAMAKTEFDLLTQIDIGKLQHLGEKIGMTGASLPGGAPAAPEAAIPAGAQ